MGAVKQMELEQKGMTPCGTCGKQFESAGEWHEGEFCSYEPECDECGRKDPDNRICKMCDKPYYFGTPEVCRDCHLKISDTLATLEVR